MNDMTKLLSSHHPTLVPRSYMPRRRGGSSTLYHLSRPSWNPPPPALHPLPSLMIILPLHRRPWRLPPAPQPWPWVWWSFAVAGTQSKPGTRVWHWRGSARSFARRGIASPGHTKGFPRDTCTWGRWPSQCCLDTGRYRWIPWWRLPRRARGRERTTPGDQRGFWWGRSSRPGPCPFPRGGGATSVT